VRNLSILATKLCARNPGRRPIFCASDPQLSRGGCRWGFTGNLDYALQTLTRSGTTVRAYDTGIRSASIRCVLREAGMIKSSPQDLA